MRGLGWGLGPGSRVQGKAEGGEAEERLGVVGTHLLWLEIRRWVHKHRALAASH